ncbi:type II secretion system protein J [uncultured Jatrophihabitans sp.]|uniref:PulJ/GspJ family protein n=1 Tax=uncultured Jatrophihabitans sp. TaxID=1610747 RepID=UPI0035CAD8A3
MLKRARRRDDAGMTLVEVIVGMTLLSVVGAVAVSFFIGTEAQANRVTEQSLVGATARTAVAQVTKLLQVADTPTASPGDATNRFVNMTATDVTFYANIAATNRSGTALRGAPTKVDIQLTNGTLFQYLYAPQGSIAPATYPTTATSKTALVSGVTNSTVFTYCSDATDPSSSCTVTTNAASVSLVQITLTVQGARGTNAQVVQSGVAITGAVS